MKTFGVLAAIAIMVSLSSCRESCTCYRTCFYYDHGNVKLCRIYPPGYYYDTIIGYNFGHAADSLTALYGPASDSIQAGPIYAAGYGDAITSAREQLEHQGYYCNCQFPK